MVRIALHRRFGIRQNQLSEGKPSHTGENHGTQERILAALGECEGAFDSRLLSGNSRLLGVATGLPLLALPRGAPIVLRLGFYVLPPRRLLRRHDVGEQDLRDAPLKALEDLHQLVVGVPRLAVPVQQ